MVATLVRTVKGKSLFSVSQNPAGLFSANKNDIARDSSGNLYTCLGGTLWEATGFDDAEKGAVISKIGSGGSGGGGGSGALVLVSDAGDYQISESQSGTTFSDLVSGVNFILPEAPADNTRFKFLGGPQPYTVQRSGSDVIASFGTSFTLAGGRVIEILSFAISGTTYWISTQVDNHAPWSSSVTYIIGDAVLRNGNVYIAKSGPHTNQDPETEPSYWSKVGGITVDEDYFDLAGKVVITGTAAPTPNFEGLWATQVDKLAILEIACRYTDTGTDNTQVEIDLTDFISDIPFPMQWTNLFKEFGRIMVNNQVFADAVFDSATYKVTATIPATNINHFLIRFAYRTQ